MSHGEQEMDDDNNVDVNDNASFAEAAPTLPSQTLYLSNLNEKIKLPGAIFVFVFLSMNFQYSNFLLFAELKKSLYELCAVYGPVLDVVASKVKKRKRKRKKFHFLCFFFSFFLSGRSFARSSVGCLS
jgi:hypothetical protein